jgi:hypothetical protein
MRIVFGLAGWLNDAVRVFDESELEADPSLLLTWDRIEGPYRMWHEGQPELEVFDDLFTLVYHLSFASAVKLHEDPSRSYLYRYMTAGSQLVLALRGPEVAITGTAVPQAAFPAAEYWPQVFACGARFLDIVKRAPGVHPNRWLDLVPLAERARAALETRGYALDVKPGPPRPPPARPIHRWAALWAVARDPDASERFYRTILERQPAGVDFVAMSPDTAPPRWIPFVGASSVSELNERLYAVGSLPYTSLGGREIWMDYWGAMFGIDELVAPPAASVRRELHAIDPEKAAAYVENAFGWSVRRTGETWRISDADAVCSVALCLAVRPVGRRRSKPVISKVRSPELSRTEPRSFRGMIARRGFRILSAVCSGW